MPGVGAPDLGEAIERKMGGDATQERAMPTDEEIRARAHQLWEEPGKPQGREHEFWHQAERELQRNETQPNQPEGSVG
jgi:Protein of unknown function (DUF2934)